MTGLHRTAALMLAVTALSALAGYFAVTSVLTRQVSELTTARASASFGGGPWTTQDAASFSGFPVYWAGQRFEHLELTAVLRDVRPADPALPYPTKRDAVIFVYGDCTPPPDSGCAPPLSIRVEPFCDMPPQLFGMVNPGAGPRVRGAQSVKAGEHVRVWTGDSAITIYADDARAARTIQALTPINGTRFPRLPVDGSLAPPATARCPAIQGAPAERLGLRAD